MSAQIAFFVSVAFSVVAWWIVTSRYIWPHLRQLPQPDALRPILLVHAFRFLGLAFLVPGVVSPELPAAFSHAAAYGDIAAATLALLSLLLESSGVGTLAAWIFNLWGSADLFNAFYQANRSGLSAGQLGATYFIPTFIVPMLLMTHAVAFRLLLRRENAVATMGHASGPLTARSAARR